ncbi:MAG TPA: hypothetical protein VNO32_35025 [Candidatus Acidoferrum sp.]|jgi:hypothetical protein|nr:hypothetical protein [Candidatus Acidoferrum sp.]
MSSRIIAGRMVLVALVSLLLCGIVASEFPELLSLTDNTANDFTIRASPLVSSVQSGKDVGKAAIEFNNPALDSRFSRLGTFEKAAFVHSDLFVLYSVLRT